jgi:hypothetical protein
MVAHTRVVVMLMLSDSTPLSKICQKKTPLSKKRHLFSIGVKSNVTIKREK